MKRPVPDSVLAVTPAYFYRLFHEGRPKPKVFDWQLDDRMPKYKWQVVTMGTSPRRLEETWSVRAARTGRWPMKKEITESSTTPVDPLSDIW